MVSDAGDDVAKAVARHERRRGEGSGAAGAVARVARVAPSAVTRAVWKRRRRQDESGDQAIRRQGDKAKATKRPSDQAMAATRHAATR